MIPALCGSFNKMPRKKEEVPVEDHNQEVEGVVLNQNDYEDQTDFLAAKKEAEEAAAAKELEKE